MAPKREGPFVISEVLGPLVYQLKLPDQWRIHPVFHASLLMPFKENDVHGPNFLSPPPDLVDGQEEYEVEAILAHRRHGRGYKFLIKWKGFAPADNTWEPATNLTNANKIIEAYKLKHRL